MTEGSICRKCFHSYVCEQFNEHRECDNEQCHFANGHFVSSDDVVEVVRCGQCKFWKINPNNLYGGQCRYSECASIDHFCSRGERRADNER